MRAVVTALVLLLATGCGDNTLDPPIFELPVVADLGGPRMAHPQLVPIFYSNDPDIEALTRFSEWIVSSRWLEEVGADYGIGAGSILRVVHRAEPAPPRVTDPEIVSWLFEGIASGSLPAPPPGGPGDIVYMVHVPVGTVVTTGASRSCLDFGGFHGSARHNGVELAFAVIASCPGLIRGLNDLEVRQFVASHEFIETATDPLPANHPGFQLREPSWSALGSEVADLCTRADATAMVREAGFVATRVWSNTAADVGEPCVPVTTDAPYFNMAHRLTSVPRIPPGSRGRLGLTAWATGEVPDWVLSTSSANPDDAELTLGARQIGPGESTNLDIVVLPSTPVGSSLRIFVFSGLSQETYQVLPVLAIVGDPCTAFTSCETCAARVGCGWCATSQRCETDGVTGSAESTCAGTDFARWPGSCGAYCGGHSDSCLDCASQAGCGWCASGGAPQCMEASNTDFSRPATGTCAYPDWSFTADYCPR
jgi:hypothetical protein